MRNCVHDILRDRLLARAGLVIAAPAKPAWTFAQLQQEWSDEFEQLMRNRLMMGALRYGPLRRATGAGYDYVASAKKRLDKYKETGNQEFLVDAANICLVLFMTDKHPLKHFGAADDGIHAEKL